MSHTFIVNEKTYQISKMNCEENTGKTTEKKQQNHVVMNNKKQAEEYLEGNEKNFNIKMTEEDANIKASEDDIPMHLMDDFLGAMLFPHFDQKAEKSFMSFKKQPKRQLFKKKNTSADLIKDLFCPAHNNQTIKFFGGKKAMEFERERSKNSGFVIHPWSKLRQYWDLLIMAMLATNMFVLPLDISFFSNNIYNVGNITTSKSSNGDNNVTSISNTFFAFHITSDIVCLIDILMNFRTGYRAGPEKSDFQLDGKKIALHYFKTWFTIDVISTLPLHFILMLFAGSREEVGIGLKGASRVIKILKVSKLLNLLKLLRLTRIIRGVSQYEEVYCWTASFIRYIKLVSMMLLVAHWNGCLHFLIPMLQEFPENCWVRLGNLERSPWYTQYGWALFSTLSHMLSVGYGRSAPLILSEAIVIIFSMVTGATFYALFIAHSMAYIAQNDSSKNSYKERYQQIKEYMIFRNLPLSLQERVSNYYEQKYHHGRFFDEEMVLSQVSPPLRKEIINYCCHDLVKNVSFFKVGSPEFISAVIHELSFDVYLSSDIICKENNLATEMFFIRKGKVEIAVGGKFIETLNAGDYFGEISLLTNGRHIVTATALTTCEMFTLEGNCFRRLLLEHPEMKPIIEHAAITRTVHILNEWHHHCGELAVDVKIDELQNGIEAYMNKSQEFDVVSHKNRRSVIKNNNKTDVNNNKPPLMLKNALKALGGIVKNDKETEEENFSAIKENIKNAIKHHKLTHEDCGLCKDAEKNGTEIKHF
ncbi:potassium/sodium hyperpolarization-activated cyclic nucleotide-gated channel 4 isoform X3 [Hydra vulgaris]|uniref:Potassium/sodium hyperpolarization-activated cyclic nucleotide-gated channel 4 isoform X3 n=1 Tax=Hydra vulgaris TaxID=6087 RepID=A0ABM4DF60_HYDVU